MSAAGLSGGRRPSGSRPPSGEVRGSAASQASVGPSRSVREDGVHSFTGAPAGAADMDSGLRWHRNGEDLDVQLMESTSDYVRFQLKNAEYSLANALRRVMIAEVPTLAIDLVEVHQNDSVLHDEMLVHRVGLVPLQTFYNDEISGERVNVAELLSDPRDCDCDSYCPKCSIEFKVHVRCTDQRRSVTSIDIVNQSSPGDAGYHVKPVHAPHSTDQYPIVIAELSMHQEIELKCTARKGIGKEHAKWNPTCTVAMQYVPEISVNDRAFNTLEPDAKERWIRVCPRRCYTYDRVRNRVTVSEENRLRCFFCMECINVPEEPFNKLKGRDQLARVSRKQDPLGRYDFVFTVETTGCMTPPECVLESIRVLKKKITGVRRCWHRDLRAQGREKEIDDGGLGPEDGDVRMEEGASTIYGDSPMTYGLGYGTQPMFAQRMQPADGDIEDEIPWS